MAKPAPLHLYNLKYKQFLLGLHLVNHFRKSLKKRFLSGNKTPTMFNVWQDVKLIKAIGLPIHVETAITLFLKIKDFNSWHYWLNRTLHTASSFKYCMCLHCHTGITNLIHCQNLQNWESENRARRKKNMLWGK